MPKLNVTLCAAAAGLFLISCSAGETTGQSSEAGPSNASASTSQTSTPLSSQINQDKSQAGALQSADNILADKNASATAGEAGDFAPVTGDLDAGLEALNSNDFATAAREFSAAFENGKPDGAFYLGRMYETGLGAPVNVAQAVAIYRAGIEKGSAASLNRLGMMHLEGKGVLQDYTEGANLICEAAEKGDKNALFNCGTLYMDGRGVEASPSKAVEYFQKAAAKDHIAASNLLGLSYLTGKGVDTDESKAVEQFSKTAGRGNLLGMVNLAKYYADEEDKGHRDLILSHMYFNLAASNGHPTAAQSRDQVQALMGKDQVEVAQKQAREWVPKP